jgi:hypothetical protein
MDRGLVVGGALICASFLIAVALNQSDGEPPENVPKEAVEAPIVESSETTPLVKCPGPDEKGLSSNPEQVAPACE